MGGGGGSGWGSQDGCERIIEFFVKIQKKKIRGWGGGGLGWGGGGGSGWGGQDGCERRIEVFVKIQKKFGGGGGVRVGGARLDVNREVKFF